MIRKLAIINMIVLLLLLAGCTSNNSNNDEENDDNTQGNLNYKQYMRDFVFNISDFAKDIDSSFILIPQNGNELITENGLENGSPATQYLNSIDGVGREDLFYGYDGDNKKTPITAQDYIISFLDIAEENDVEVLVTDYCSTKANMDDSYKKNAEKKYISFSADHRELDNIPEYPVEPYNVNSDNITTLKDAKNFLYLLNPGEFSTKEEFLKALHETNFDLLIIDLFYDDQALSISEIGALKTKANGGSRLVIAYMSIGEAEDYRFYWRDDWNTNKPIWLEKENPNWKGNYKVRYWDSDWQSIIYGSDGSYLKKIIDSGFDGVYLDIIDAFEYFEDK